jgi:hypothetical protein
MRKSLRLARNRQTDSSVLPYFQGPLMSNQVFRIGEQINSSSSFLPSPYPCHPHSSPPSPHPCRHKSLLEHQLLPESLTRCDLMRPFEVITLNVLKVLSAKLQLLMKPQPSNINKKMCCTISSTHNCERPTPEEW